MSRGNLQAYHLLSEPFTCVISLYLNSHPVISTYDPDKNVAQALALIIADY